MEAVSSNDDMMAIARDYFRENKYNLAEPILNQLILKHAMSPEVFHMLGTIYYDQGKFNKAIRAFRRALELEPTFTDASVGLSIILNDLGKYEEGRKVFDEARDLLARWSAQTLLDQLLVGGVIPVARVAGDLRTPPVSALEVLLDHLRPGDVLQVLAKDARCFQPVAVAVDDWMLELRAQIRGIVSRHEFLPRWQKRVRGEDTSGPKLLTMM